MEREASWWENRVVLLTALLLGNAALATGPYFVRIADSGAVSAGFWRLLLALPFLLLFARMGGEKPLAIPNAAKLAVLAAGVVFAFDLSSWHIGIEMTRLGNATMFGNSGSLVLMVWGFVMWRRLPRGAEWLAIICALAGAGILLGGSLEISTGTLVGDLFCLAAGMFYAGYLLILQNARANAGSWTLLLWSGLAGAPVMLTIGLFLGEPVWPTDWTPLIALFVTSQLIGQGLLVFSLRHFPPLIIGLALLTQPALAALIGWAAFQETPTALDVFGMILLGLALAVARGRQGR